MFIYQSTTDYTLDGFVYTYTSSYSQILSFTYSATYTTNATDTTGTINTTDTGTTIFKESQYITSIVSSNGETYQTFYFTNDEAETFNDATESANGFQSAEITKGISVDSTNETAVFNPDSPTVTTSSSSFHLITQSITVSQTTSEITISGDFTYDSTTTVETTSIFSVVNKTTFFTTSISYSAITTTPTISSETTSSSYKTITITAPGIYTIKNSIVANNTELLWKPKDIYTGYTNFFPLNSDYVESFTSSIFLPTFDRMELNAPNNFSTSSTMTIEIDSTLSFVTFTNKSSILSYDMLSPVFSEITETIYISSISVSSSSGSESSGGNISYTSYSVSSKVVLYTNTIYNDYTSFTFSDTSEEIVVEKSTVFDQLPSTFSSSNSGETNSINPGNTNGTTSSVLSEGGYVGNVTLYRAGNQFGEFVDGKGAITEIFSEYKNAFALPLLGNTSTNQSIGSNIIFNNINITINPYGRMAEKQGVSIPLPANYTDIISVNSLGSSLQANSWTTITVNWLYDSVSVTYSKSNDTSFTIFSEKLSIDGVINSSNTTKTIYVVCGDSNATRDYPFGYYAYTEYEGSSSSTNSFFIEDQNVTTLVEASEKLRVFANVSYGIWNFGPNFGDTFEITNIKNFITEQRNNSIIPPLNYFYDIQTDTTNN